MEDVYRNAGEIPEYIKNKEDAKRNYYVDDAQKDREIITSLIGVDILNESFEIVFNLTGRKKTDL